MRPTPDVDRPPRGWPSTLPPWPVVLSLNALLLPFCFLGLHSIDTDTFYHLAAGRWMFEHGRVLDHETFSFTIPGRPWTNYYWAFEWLLFGAYRVLGLPGVFALRALFMIPTANLFVYWVYHRTRGAVPETLAFGALVFSLYVRRALNVRPHLFSYLALLVILVLLESFKRGRNAAGIAVVIVIALLANAHGVEYPVVLAAILLYLGEALLPHLRRPVTVVLREPNVARLVVLLLASGAALLMNPFGARLLATPLIGMDKEVMAQIKEMQPVILESLGSFFPRLDLDSDTPRNLVVAAGLLLLPGWIRRRQWLAAAFYALGLALALDKSRFSVELLLLAVPFVAQGMADARRRLALANARVLRGILLAVAAYVAVATLATVRASVRGGNLEPVSTGFYPVGAVRYLQRYDLGENLHCDPGIAGYVTWTLYPRVRTSMDMRTPEPFAAGDYWFSSALGGAVTFERATRRFPIDLVLLGRKTSLASTLAADPQFAPVYADPWFILFAHERLLVGDRAKLRLRTLPFMEELEAGRIASGDEPAGLREEAERLASVWPANNLAQRALLWLLMSEGRFPDCATKAAALAQQFPRQALYPFFEGLAFQKTGDPRRAAAAFQRAIDVMPDFALPYASLAETLASLGRNDEAVDLMERSTWGRWSTVTATEYALLGRARLRVGRIRPAIDALQRAEWLLDPGDPTRPDLENTLALALLAAGEPARALQWLEDALTLRPAFPLAALTRARALAALGRTDEARAALETLLRDPRLPPVIRTAAEAQRGR